VVDRRNSVYKIWARHKQRPDELGLDHIFADAGTRFPAHRRSPRQDLRPALERAVHAAKVEQRRALLNVIRRMA
jgi:hypothetical protein